MIGSFEFKFIMNVNKFDEFNKYACSIDCDGALLHAQMREKDVISKNIHLLKYLNQYIELFKLSGQNPKVCFFVFLGSNRQSKRTDDYNAKSNNTCSGFQAIQKVAEYLGVTLDKFLMADLYNDLDPGTSFNKATMGIVGFHGDWIFDHSKVTLLYAQMHKLAQTYPNEKIRFDFFDDRRDILNGLYAFFSQNPELIPKNVVLGLNVYEGDRSPVHLSDIKGTGIIDGDYQQTVKDMADQSLKLSSNSTINAAADVNKYKLSIVEFPKEKNRPPFTRISELLAFEEAELKMKELQTSFSHLKKSYPDSSYDDVLSSAQKNLILPSLHLIQQIKKDFSKDLNSFYFPLKDVKKLRLLHEQKGKKYKILGSTSIEHLQARAIIEEFSQANIGDKNAQAFEKNYKNLILSISDLKLNLYGRLNEGSEAQLMATKDKQYDLITQLDVFSELSAVFFSFLTRENFDQAIIQLQIPSFLLWALEQHISLFFNDMQQLIADFITIHREDTVNLEQISSMKARLTDLIKREEALSFHSIVKDTIKQNPMPLVKGEEVENYESALRKLLISYPQQLMLYLEKKLEIDTGQNLSKKNVQQPAINTGALPKLGVFPVGKEKSKKRMAKSGCKPACNVF